MGGGKGGGKGGGSTSNAESRQLGGIANRFEQEARPVREGALGQLAGILNYGADVLGPSMGGPSNYPGGPGPQQGPLTPSEPRRFSRADLMDAYSKYDVGKGQDVNRILGNLGDNFTLDELKAGADLGGLSGRSKQAWESSIGELERLSKSGGSGMGGMGGGGGYGGAMLPIAQTAVERSKQATSQSLQALTEQFASMKGGGAGNPFAQRALSQARVMGDQATSQIPSRIVEQYLQNVLPLAFGQSPVAVQGLSNAAGVNASLQQGNQAAGASGAAGANQALSAIGSAIGAYFGYAALAAT